MWISSSAAQGGAGASQEDDVAVGDKRKQQQNSKLKYVVWKELYLAAASYLCHSNLIESAFSKIAERIELEASVISKEQERHILHETYKETTGCRSRKGPGHGYLAKYPTRSQLMNERIEEQARASALAAAAQQKNSEMQAEAGTESALPTHNEPAVVPTPIQGSEHVQQTVRDSVLLSKQKSIQPSRLTRSANRSLFPNDKDSNETVTFITSQTLRNTAANKKLQCRKKGGKEDQP
ncbi:unnamed protein product [Miscanthus lutarioriparius]|uniref:Uncharacterized protein n=1 Tax=Miscanthus lutarioriparius TaxID=422564 RepID=A0A811N9V3_9POAL|nr:unnamed protein product [Miscanthus lutarioriparius]